MLGYFHDDSNIFLVLEHCSGGDLLSDEFIELDKDVRLKRARRILFQLCQALAYLQSLQVAHRDLKPENVLLVTDTSKDTVKLCDFGWATWWKRGCYHQTLCGTAEFVPPELLSGEEAAYLPEFVDSWALGVLAMEMVEDGSPFRPSISAMEEVEDAYELQCVIFDSIRAFDGELPQIADPDLRDFVTRLMQVDPASRMTAEEALDHSFLHPCRKSHRPVLGAIQVPTVAQRCQLFEQTAHK